jgi:hypothetical protein
MLDCDSFKIFAKRKVEALSTVEPPESPNAVTQGPRVLENEECWYGPYEVLSFCPRPTTSRVFCVSSNIKIAILGLLQSTTATRSIHTHNARSGEYS